MKHKNHGQQIGGLKTQNKFIRSDIKGIRLEISILAVLISIIGLSVIWVNL